jgi:hypothetical protein
MEIRRITQSDAVRTASQLFDGPPRPQDTERFLADPRHHLLLAYVGDEPAGMISGVEMTYPDKGTEMFLYELGVDEPFRGRVSVKRWCRRWPMWPANAAAMACGYSPTRTTCPPRQPITGSAQSQNTRR